LLGVRKLVHRLCAPWLSNGTAREATAASPICSFRRLLLRIHASRMDAQAKLALSRSD
jgi:hypothetical protein